MRTELDHLVVVAPTLAMGAQFVNQALGVEPQAGGAHLLMGTHNLVLRLGPRAYLEVIAADPAAPHPGRPRWFALDHLSGDGRPRLATWVARTLSIDAAARAAPYLGRVETMTRGSMRWRITIPADGGLAHGGLIPSLIEWPSESHPTASMRDCGCSLSAFEAFHPAPDMLRTELAALGLNGVPAVSALRTARAPYLVAHIDTPSGPRSIGV